MSEYKIVYQDQGKVYKRFVNKEELNKISSTHTLIKVQKKKRYTLTSFKTISSKELLILFTELELMMRSHLTLYESLIIIKKSVKKPILKSLVHDMLEALKQGQSLYDAIKSYEKSLDAVVLAFFKLSHTKGNTYLMIKAICDILQTKQENKTLLFSSLSYPLFIWCSFCIAMLVIFQMVIPKFEYIFIQYNMQLPIYTSLLLSFKSFILNYFWLIIIVFVTLFIFVRLKVLHSYWLWHKDKWLIKNLPILGKIYQYYELHNLFVGLRILMSSKYEFNVALENSSLLLNNQYLLAKIQNLQQHIHNGMSLYEAFLKVDIFDDLVLNVIHAAQMSSTLTEALEKIEIYYKNKFTIMIKRFSSTIEPLFFVIMMLLILWVMLAIFTPIWNMSEMINL